MDGTLGKSGFEFYKVIKVRMINSPDGEMSRLNLLAKKQVDFHILKCLKFFEWFKIGMSSPSYLGNAAESHYCDSPTNVSTALGMSTYPNIKTIDKNKLIF